MQLFKTELSWPFREEFSLARSDDMNYKITHSTWPYEMTNIHGSTHCKAFEVQREHETTKSKRLLDLRGYEICPWYNLPKHLSWCDHPMTPSHQHEGCQSGTRWLDTLWVSVCPHTAQHQKQMLILLLFSTGPLGHAPIQSDWYFLWPAELINSYKRLIEG